MEKCLRTFLDERARQRKSRDCREPCWRWASKPWRFWLLAAVWAPLCIGSLLIASKNASNIRAAARQHLPGIKGKGAGTSGDVSNSTAPEDIRFCRWVIPKNTTWIEHSPADSCDDCGHYLSMVFSFATVGLISWFFLVAFLWVRHPGLVDHVYHRRKLHFKREEPSCWWRWLHCLPLRKRFLFCHETVQSTERAGALAILPFLFFAVMLLPYDPFQSRILLEATNLFCAVLLGMVALGVARALTRGGGSEGSNDDGDGDDDDDDEEEDDLDGKTGDAEEQEAVEGAASLLAGRTMEPHDVGDDDDDDAEDGDEWDVITEGADPENTRWVHPHTGFAPGDGQRTVSSRGMAMEAPPRRGRAKDEAEDQRWRFVHAWGPLVPASGQTLYTRVIRYITTHDVLQGVFQYRNILHATTSVFFVGLLCLQTLVICPNEKRPVVAQTGSISGVLSLFCALVASFVSILFITDLIFSVPASDFAEAKVWVAEIRRMLDGQLDPIIRAARRAGSGVAKATRRLEGLATAGFGAEVVDRAGMRAEPGDEGTIEDWGHAEALTPLLAEWWRTMDGIGERRVKHLIRAGRRRLVWVLLGSVGLLVATLLRYLGRYGTKGGLLLALLDGVTALMVTLTFGSFAAGVLVMKETLRVGKLADGIVARIRSARLFLEVMLESLRLNKAVVRGNTIVQMETVVRQLEKFEGALSKGSSLAPTLCGFRVRQELVVGYVITLLTGVLVPLVQSIILSS